MKKVLFLAVSILVFSASVASATTFKAEENFKLSEVLQDDLYITGNIVVIDQNVEGDLFVMAREVIINGNINGDLLATAGTVTVNGQVQDDARIVGGQINIKNNIGSDLMVTAANLMIDQNVTVGGDLSVAVGLLDMAGQIEKDAEAVALNLQFNGSIKGNADFIVDKNVNIADNAFIGGNLSYYAIQKTDFADNVVQGETKFNELQGKDGFLNELRSQFNSGRIILNVLTYFSFLLVVGVFIMISPKYALKGAEELKQNFGQILLIGVITAVAILLGSILLIVSVVGIPLGVITLVLGLVSLYIGRVFVAVWLGNLLVKLKKTPSKWATFGVAALGAAIYWILSLIPFYLGLFFSLLLAFLGLGTIVKVKHNYFKQLQKSKML